MSFVSKEQLDDFFKSIEDADKALTRLKMVEPEIYKIVVSAYEKLIHKHNRLSYLTTSDVSPVRRYLDRTYRLPSTDIKEVIFNDPATVVIWSDGTKTVVKCQPGDEYSRETGLAMCIAKKYLGNKGNFNETFKKFIEDYDPREV